VLEGRRRRRGREEGCKYVQTEGQWETGAGRLAVTRSGVEAEGKKGATRICFFFCFFFSHEEKPPSRVLTLPVSNVRPDE